MVNLTARERKLVVEAQGGDGEAFEELVRMNQEPLYRYMYRLTGNIEDAMELTQSSFVKAFLSLGKFRGESSFKTYLFRIASNAWKNSIRDRSKRKHVAIDLIPLQGYDNPHEEVARKEQQEILWSVIHQLPPRQKEALVLRAREGYPFETVARIMGCSTGSAKASYHNAVVRIKKALKEDTS